MRPMRGREAAETSMPPKSEPMTSVHRRFQSLAISLLRPFVKGGKREARGGLTAGHVDESSVV